VLVGVGVELYGGDCKVVKGVFVCVGVAVFDAVTDGVLVFDAVFVIVCVFVFVGVKDAVTDGVKETVCDGEFVLVMVFV
jgi:hypothetical protein